MSFAVRAPGSLSFLEFTLLFQTQRGEALRIGGWMLRRLRQNLGRRKPEPNRDKESLFHVTLNDCRTT